MTFNNLSEVWAYYDVKDRKHFDTHDLCAAIAPLKEGPEQVPANHELLAFNFVASTRHQPNEWDTFYTYQFAGKNKKNEDIFIPDIKDITPEIIAYWEQRAATVINPLLKTRYTGLVLDFKKRITGNNPDYKTIKLAHVEALIEVVAGDYCKHSLITLDYALRALQLANGFRKEDLKQRVVQAFYETHKRIDAKDSSAGLWGRIVKALIKYRKAFAAYEEDIIQEDNLKIVDFTEKVNLFRVFYDDGEDVFKQKVKRRVLFDAFSSDLSKPLRNFDSELEYIPTQYICEYFKDRGADGIMFKSSVREAGKNLVLFYPELAECIDVHPYEVNEITISRKAIL
jgi:hypothetical protein